MNERSGIQIDRGLIIPISEIDLRFTTSGGPGGQHANKAATRVELLWNVDDSAVLSDRQRSRVKGHLKNRIDSEGNLRIVADTHRSQMRNRREAADRLAAAVAEALRPRRRRVSTKPTKAAVERRLNAKRRRSETKRMRKHPFD